MTQLCLALVGAGARGWGLARLAVQDDRRARLRAVADPIAGRREAFAEEFSIPRERCFPTHADMLRRCADLDGVILASSVAAHAEAACDCLEAGIPVFLEKPMALDLRSPRKASLAGSCPSNGRKLSHRPTGRSIAGTRATTGGARLGVGSLRNRATISTW